MKIKEYRTKNKLSQQQVANILNISQRAYASYELGQSQPTSRALSTLADFYHTTIDDLVGRQSPKLYNLNLLSDEERTIIENLEHLSRDNLIKVQAYVDFCLQDQKK